MTSATVAGALRQYGVNLTEADLAAAVERNFSSLVTWRRAAALSAAEIDILSDGGLDFAGSDGAYTRATADAVGAYTALVADSVSAVAAAQQLGVTRPRVQQLLGRGELWGIKVGARWLLPQLQFTADGRALPGLGPMLRALHANERHPLQVSAFLTTAQPELELDDRALTPIEWLAAGGSVETVRALAEGVDIA